MATQETFGDDLPFSIDIKYLDNDELLDIWLETQKLECYFNAEFDVEIENMPEYEKIIMDELQCRSFSNFKIAHFETIL